MTEQEQPRHPDDPDPDKKKQEHQDEGDEDAAEELGEILQNLRDQLASLERKLGADVERTSEPKIDPKEEQGVAKPAKKEPYISRTWYLIIAFEAGLILVEYFVPVRLVRDIAFYVAIASLPLLGLFLWYDGLRVLTSND